MSKIQNHRITAFWGQHIGLDWRWMKFTKPQKRVFVQRNLYTERAVAKKHCSWSARHTKQPSLKKVDFSAAMFDLSHACLPGSATHSIWLVVWTPQNITLWYTNIAMENHHYQWVNQLWITIFNSYVCLPDGNCFGSSFQVKWTWSYPFEITNQKIAMEHVEFWRNFASHPAGIHHFTHPKYRPLGALMIPSRGLVQPWDYYNIPLYWYWLVVYLPLWKIIISQWEGWHPIYEMENKSHVPNHQPVIHYYTTKKMGMVTIADPTSLRVYAAAPRKTTLPARMNKRKTHNA